MNNVTRTDIPEVDWGSLDPLRGWQRMTAWARGVARALAPAWDDLQGPATIGANVTALTLRQYRGGIARVRCLSYNTAQPVTYTFQMRHKWVRRTRVFPHIHLIPLANGSGVLAYTVQYEWSGQGQELPATWVSASVRRAVTAADRYREQIFDLVEGGVQPPEWAGPSSTLWVVFQVDTTNTTYSTLDGSSAANVALVDVDAHCMSSARLGTVNPYGDV